MDKYLVLYYKEMLKFLIPIVVPCFIFLLQLIFWDYFYPFVWILFYPAVFFMAWIGGLKWGIISLSTSLIIVFTLFIPITHSFHSDYINNLASALVLTVTTLIFGYLQEQPRVALLKLLFKSKVIETISEGVMTTNSRGVITSINPAFTIITGYTENELLGKNPRIIKSSRHDNLFFKTLWSTIGSGNIWSGEVWNRKKNGEIFLSSETISPIVDINGDIISYVSVLTDITTVKTEQDNIQFKAYHDTLTNLPNRLLFMDRLDLYLKLAKRNNNSVALMYIDLDKFKPINDTYGHAIGDVILCMAAKRINNAIREMDTVARIGGDEFAAIFIDVKSETEIKSIAQKVINSLNSIFVVEKYELSLSASIGIAFYPKDSDNLVDLIALADKAMYIAKEKGGSCYVCQP